MRRVLSLHRALAALAGVALAPAGARAEEAGARFGGAVSFTLENDLFNNGDDEDYTNGVLFSLASPRFHAPASVVGVARRIGFDKAEFRTEIGLSQAMFTPRDLTRATPDPADRPYAGVTLLSMSLVSDRPARLKAKRFDQFAYYIGAVGPASGADRSQKWVHKQLHATAPQGWSTQVPDRVIGGLSFQSTRNINPGQAAEGDRAIDGLWHYGFSLGSFQTNAEVGATVRAGWHMPRDFGLPRLAPSLPGSGYFETSHLVGGYVFAGAAERYVGYDVTLDERPSRGAGKVDRTDWVSDAQAGFLAYAGCFRFGYTHVWRSEVFHGQREGHGFGSLAVSYSLPGAGADWRTCR